MTTDPHTTEPDRGRLLTAHSTVALVLAPLLTVTLHECAHAVAGLALGVTPTLYAQRVDFDPQPDGTGQIITAAAGPLFSLVLGLALYLLCRRTGRGFVRLLLLWAGLVSMQNFAGYLIIAPFAQVGDTGRVLSLLAAPTAAYVVAFVVGVLLQLLNARLLAGQVVRYATGRDELRHLVLFPWLIGTGVAVVLTLLDLTRSDTPGADVAVILAGAATLSIFAPMFFFFYRRLDQPYERLELRRPVGPVLVTVVTALLVFLVLAPGLRLG